MKNQEFLYTLTNDTVVFTDTLYKGAPYISISPRTHESIFFVTKGNLLYEREGKQTIIPCGQVGYIPKGASDISGAADCGSVSYIAVNFRFDRSCKTISPTLPLDTLCSKGLFGGYEALFRQALKSYRTALPGYMTVVNGIIMQIVGMLYGEMSHSAANIRQIKRLESALEHLKNNFSDRELKISRLAEIAEMSDKQFRRIFFEVYGKKPYEFLQEYRISAAEVLLLNTGSSISEIAERCGFSDVYSFSHSFKSYRGVSPLKYKGD